MEEREIYEEDSDSFNQSAKIKVIGVGGGGSNAVNRMLDDKTDGVDFIVLNTDAQALAASKCKNKYVIGRTLTKGLGAGGDPNRGREAALASKAEIESYVAGADLVFIACGEGGGTGTGAAPVVAEIAKNAGALVLAIITRPFKFEGKNRHLNAANGINELKKHVDSIIIISNDQLTINNGNTPLLESFKLSDNVLATSVKTITDLILKHGLVNLDFADVKSTLTSTGLAMIGFGVGKGEKKGIDAAKAALSSPLLELSIRGARSFLINVVISKSTSTNDVSYAIDYITELATGKKDGSSEVSIIFGVQIDENMEDDMMKIAIIATNFTSEGISENNSYESTADKRITETEKEIERNRKQDIEPDYFKFTNNK